MGSPNNNVHMVTGAAKVPVREISPIEWCCILGHALRKIEPCLKYVAGFKTLGQLLNSREKELPLGCPRIFTPQGAMPKLDGTPLNPKTKFVALQWLEPAKDSAANGNHQIDRGLLLLSEGGNFVVLNLSYFKQAKGLVVCGSSLMPNSLAGCFSLAQSAIRDCIYNESLSPYNVLDELYLLFGNTVDEREKRLDSMRQARDMLQQMCGRISLGNG